MRVIQPTSNNEALSVPARHSGRHSVISVYYKGTYLTTLGDVFDDIIRDALAHCEIAIVQAETERWRRLILINIICLRFQTTKHSALLI